MAFPPSGSRLGAPHDAGTDGESAQTMLSHGAASSLPHPPALSRLNAAAVPFHSHSAAFHPSHPTTTVHNATSAGHIDTHYAPPRPARTVAPAPVPAPSSRLPLAQLPTTSSADNMSAAPRPAPSTVAPTVPHGAPPLPGGLPQPMSMPFAPRSLQQQQPSSNAAPSTSAAAATAAVDAMPPLGAQRRPAATVVAHHHYQDAGSSSAYLPAATTTGAAVIGSDFAHSRSSAAPASTTSYHAAPPHPATASSSVAASTAFDPRERFIRKEKIGEGTYGVVYRCIDQTTGHWVALKRIRLETEEDGVPATAIREISLLREVQHPNVVALLDVVCQDKKIQLVFEYVDQDLKRMLDRRGDHRLDGPHLKSVAFQLISGVLACHSHRVVHRDLKPQNILVSADGKTVKIADFGLARAFQIPLHTYTHEVITLWYRPPEILLGERHYRPAVDMWSLGCIIGELALGRVIFPGECEIHQLFQIFQVMGTPDESVWPGISMLPDFGTVFPKWRAVDASQIFGECMDEQGVDLMRGLLTYCPRRRLSAHAAYWHPWFDDIRVVPTGGAAVAPSVVGEVATAVGATAASSDASKRGPTGGPLAARPESTFMNVTNLPPAALSGVGPRRDSAPNAEKVAAASATVEPTVDSTVA